MLSRTSFSIQLFGLCGLQYRFSDFPVLNIVELIRIIIKSIHHVAEKFENSWLYQYQKPNRCVHNNKKEFIGRKFLNLLGKYGIKDVCTAVRNYTNPPTNINDTNQVIDNTLSICIQHLCNVVFCEFTDSNYTR